MKRKRQILSLCVLFIPLLSTTVFSQVLIQRGSVTGYLSSGNDVGFTDRAMVVDSGDSVAIYNIEDLDNPFFVRRLGDDIPGSRILSAVGAASPGGDVLFIGWQDQYPDGYTPSDTYLKLYDFADPANPIEMREYNMGYQAYIYGMENGDGYIFVSHRQPSYEGEQVFDRFYTYDDWYIGRSGHNVFSENYSFRDMTLHGNYVYYAQGFMSGRLWPFLVSGSFYPRPYIAQDVAPECVAAAGIRLYTKTGFQTTTTVVSTFDISNPGYPVLLGTVNWQGYEYYTARMEAIGNYIIIAEHLVPLQVIDMSDPVNPIVMQTLAQSGSSVEKFNDHIVAQVGNQIVFYDYVGGEYIPQFELLEPVDYTHQFELDAGRWFRWEPTETSEGNPVTFELQFAADSSFQTILATHQTELDSIFITDLPESYSMLFWRVRAFYQNMQTFSHSFRRLHTLNLYHPRRFTLLEPSDGASVTTEEVQLVWTSSLSRNMPEFDELDDFGGPDSEGYLWLDSSEPYGPNPQWIDISDTGTWLNISTLNHASEVVDLPGMFPFYGERYDHVHVTSDGYIHFDDRLFNHDSWLYPMPDPTPPNAVIAPWNSSTFGFVQSGDIYVQAVDSDKFVIQWNDVFYGSTGFPVTFQVVLHKSGVIYCNYNQIPASTVSAVVGIEDELGQTGFSLPTDYVESLDPPWTLVFQPGDVAYSVMVADNPEFENFRRIVTADTTCTIGPFAMDRTWYWRVMAVDRFRMKRPVTPFGGWSFTVDLNAARTNGERGDPEYEADAAGDEFGATSGEFSNSLTVSPNPSNAVFQVTVELADRAEVSLRVYDLLGRLVLNLDVGALTPGRHPFTLDASSLTSGVYFLHVSAPGVMDQVRKVVLVK
ncbi:T9SS type A sorting domain-containing protein [bacterium]|nr:T9SS type A sorting domain-containing protein [bacterium]